MPDTGRSRLAFITGASSGIGQALAARFHLAGYRLALVGRRTGEINSWATQHGMATDSFQIYSGDVSVIDSIVGAGQACLAQQGVPDVVIAAAGISVGVDTATRADLDVISQVFATNNIGTAATFHPFIGPMSTRGSGTLVGIGSVNGIRGLPGHGATCPSKAAVISYCESLRGELRSTGVKVVTLCPGYIDTPLTRDNQFRMPFLMPADRFADKAFAAIETGVSYRVIPWQMGVVAKILRLMPNSVFDRAMAGRPRKPRKSAE